VKRIPTRVLVGIGVLVAVLLAAVVSRYASDRPDGLQRVAADHGLAEADQPPTAGLMPDDPQLAGVVGLLVVLVLATGTTYVLRRRSRDDEDPTETTGGR
jgi:hypothetical protein